MYDFIAISSYFYSFSFSEISTIFFFYHIDQASSSSSLSTCVVLNIRYKFVVDRAKRLLESADLPSLRQVLDADSNPANTADDSVELLCIHDAAGHGRHEPSCRVPEYYPDGQGGWDNFAMPGSERQPFLGHTRNGSPIERQAAGGVVAPQGLHGDQSKGCSQTNEIKAGAKVTAGTRQRQSLSLAQLRISPEAVLPQRHVPSVMGDKGYGTKRGRINHFEFPTPPSTPGRSDDATTVDVGRYVGYDDKLCNDKLHNKICNDKLCNNKLCNDHVN